MKVLIVEDEELKRITLLADLVQAGHTVTAADSARQALEILEREQLDVVITDLKLPGMDGLELLRTIKEEFSPSTEVIMMTAYGTIPVAVEAIRRGALDFVTKPFDNRQMLPLLARIEQKMARKDLSREPHPAGEFSQIEQAVIGKSPPIRHLKHLIRLCAESDSNVLLCGETGTGKDLAAAMIHKISARHSSPLVKVSCATFPENLVESELFGHERGAFTGADQRKSGRLELARNGTLYLDDVDDIPLAQQVKLLRVIDEKVFERVGSSTSIRCDVRFIASTKVDLTRRIAEGTFREDLYYRLKVIEVHLPPLRERPEDIPELAAYLLKRIAGERSAELSAEVIQRLRSYAWPGNVRELAHMLEQAQLISRGRIGPEHFNFPAGTNAHHPAAAEFKSTIERTESELLRSALDQHGGNKTRAAKHLGMKPSTFRDKLRKHGIE